RRGGGPARRDPVDLPERVLGRAALVRVEAREAEVAGQRRDVEQVRPGGGITRYEPEGQRVESAGARLVRLERRRSTDGGEVADELLPRCRRFRRLAIDRLGEA